MSDCRFGVSPVNYPDPDSVDTCAHCDQELAGWHNEKICVNEPMMSSRHKQ